MSEPQLDFIRKKVDTLRVLAQDAQRRVTIVNSVVAEVAQSGLLPRTAILGQVIQNRSYPAVAGGRSSGQVLQAALLVPCGVGVLFWDSEEFFELENTPDALEADAWLHFTSFDECEPAIQGLIGCQIDDLINRFMQEFR